MKPTENRTAIILRFIHRHFIWMIVSSYIIAAMMPGFGLWIRNVNFGGAGILQSNLVFSLPLLMLATLLFNAGLGAKTEELTRLVQKPFVLLGGLFCNLTVPLAFIVAVSFLMHIWHDPEEVQQILVGLALVAAMPIAGASTAWSQNANGSLALSLGLVLGSTALSPLLTPFVLHMAGFVTTGDYSEDLHELASGEAASFLGVWVILPTLLGLHMLAGEILFEIINYCILLLLNYSNASSRTSSSGRKPDCSMRTRTPPVVGVSVQVTTVFSPFAASSPEAFQL